MVGRGRGRELSTADTLFKPVQDDGAQLVRHDGTQESARAILGLLITNKSMALCIQRELPDEDKELADTAAGATPALNGTQNAYQAVVSPAQTQVDLTALNQTVHVLAGVLRESSVGAYPLPAADSVRNASPPTEQQFIAEFSSWFKRMQESSAVAANFSAARDDRERRINSRWFEQ
ncbi:hypothetical protein J3R83DRAFT_4918 [Lanmaoa asiatica]|nr:hypothetical protein J3R83DRAFT_4918 [Lanmaoa asiatica]